MAPVIAEQDSSSHNLLDMAIRRASNEGLAHCNGRSCILPRFKI